MAKRFKVEIRDGTLISFEVSADDSPECWLKKQPECVRIYESEYPNEEIVSVEEIPSAGGGLLKRG
jgi:hypothetical protein